MATDQYRPVRVSRRIEAPPEVVFGIISDPRQHLALDGSGMLRGAVSTEPVTGVGDVFVMKMYFVRLGDYEMNNHVVEFEPNKRIGWEPEAGRGHPDAAPGSSEPARWGQRWSYDLVADGPGATVVTEIYDCSRVPADARIDMQDGQVWIDDMTQTLERLAALCAEQTARHS
jgi:hypothetical protein